MEVVEEPKHLGHILYKIKKRIILKPWNMQSFCAKLTV